MTASPAIDLFDHQQTQNLWDVTQEWRAHSPVVWAAEDYAYVSRWADCWQVLRDPQLFSNANGFKSVVVSNVAELEMLMMHNRTYAATVAHSVSTRVRRDIIERAEQLAIRVTNAAAKLRAEEDA